VLWQERNNEEFIAIQQKLVNQEQWIIDCNSTKSFEMRYKRADICPYFISPDVFVIGVFLRDFFIKKYQLMWGFEKQVDPILYLLNQNYPDVRFIEINSGTALKKLALA
jgi:hypothetical protein